MTKKQKKVSRESTPLYDLKPGQKSVSRADPWMRSDTEKTAWKSAIEVLEKHRDELLGLPGIVSVEVAPRLVDKSPTPVPSIRAYVYRKRSREALSSDELLPERLGGIPVDVVPASFRATGCDPTSLPLRRRWSYAQGGCTIGKRGANTFATLGAFFFPADSSDQLLGLTAGHAYRIGDQVVQPAGGAAKDVIGKIIDQEVSDEIDAAIIEVDPRRRKLVAGVAGMGGPLKLKNLRLDGKYEPVLMVGGCGGWAVGWARLSSGSIPIDYPSGQVFLSEYIHIVSGDGNKPFNRSGDSGALLLSQNGAYAYGLVIAAGEFEGRWAGIATPIGRIADRFSLRIAVY